MLIKSFLKSLKQTCLVTDQEKNKSDQNVVSLEIDISLGNSPQFYFLSLFLFSSCAMLGSEHSQLLYILSRVKSPEINLKWFSVIFIFCEVPGLKLLTRADFELKLISCLSVSIK